jgi:hypothetical protein
MLETNSISCFNSRTKSFTGALVLSSLWLPLYPEYTSPFDTEIFVLVDVGRSLCEYDVMLAGRYSFLWSPARQY